MYVSDKAFYDDFASSNHRIAAVSYAMSHDGENERNEDYRYFGQYGDCTNFVSQCIHAGGISMSNEWYYYGGHNYSRTWGVASDFYYYIVNSEYCTGVAFVRNASSNLDSQLAGRGIKPGDLIALQDDDHNKRVYHMAIITSIDGLGNIRYSGHSNFREDHLLHDSLANGTNNLYIIKMNY